MLHASSFFLHELIDRLRSLAPLQVIETACVAYYEYG